MLDFIAELKVETRYMGKEIIVSGYARMWPREVFGKFPPLKGAASKRKEVMAKGLRFLEGPYYIGRATNLRSRLWSHAIQAEGRYFHFWNFFSAFAIPNRKHRDELEGVLIAAMPTANSANPRVQREQMPREVRDLLRNMSLYRTR